MTLDIYIHMIPRKLEKATSIIDSLTTSVALPIELTAPKLHPKPNTIDPKMSMFLLNPSISPLKRYNLPSLVP